MKLCAFLLAVLVVACTVHTDDNFPNPPAPPPDTCAPSDAVAGCGAGSVGYACTADRPDDGDTNLVCSAGTAGVASTAYCCLPFGQYYSECTVDDTIAGCADPGFGFSCSGAVGPADVDSRLACSAAIASNGASSYCCLAADVTPACAPAPNATCGAAAVGYACTGDQSPGDSSDAMACDDGMPGEAGATVHCCVPFHQSKEGCQERQGGCPADSFGFTCANSLRPETYNAGLSCESTGDASYCCTLH